TSGQEEKKEPPKIYVSLGGTRALEMTSKKPLAVVRSDKEGIVRLDVMPPQATRYVRFELGEVMGKVEIMFMRFANVRDDRDKRRVFAPGDSLGQTKVKLVDTDGKEETLTLEVRRELPLPTGITYKLEPPVAKKLVKVMVDNEKVARAIIPQNS